MPFPTQFPQAAMEHLVQELLGVSTEPLAQLVEDAYDVLGYGLYLGFSGGQVTLARCGQDFADVSAMESAEKADVLKESLHPQAVNAQIPWTTILPIVLDLLKKWLTG